MGWLVSRPQVSSVIAGVTSPQQLEQNVAAGHWRSGDEELQEIEKITALSPDLVFLDIQMPVLNGFEVLEQLVTPPPVVVFITAYDEYAIKAFEVNAVDYLKKPCPKERFLTAMERARTSLLSGADAKKEIRGRLGNLLSDIRRDTGYLDRLLIKEGSRITILELPDILWLEAQDDYVTIHTRNGDSHLVTRTLTSFVSRLNSPRFIRVHRSAIVNLDRITSLRTLFHGQIVAVLDDGTEVKVSRSRRETLLSRIEHYSSS